MRWPMNVNRIGGASSTRVVCRSSHVEGWLWRRDLSCIRQRPEHVNHIWRYDFLGAETRYGETVKMQHLKGVYPREPTKLSRM